MPNLELSDLAGLSKPATTLIEKVSDAVGGIAKPWQVTRVAKAEAKAEIARAEARIQISEMEERALQRMVREEGKRQENIESITAQATEHLDESAKPEAVEEDWIANFFEKARLTSDKEMQKLWSRILAGEANAPGRYSKRTIEIVSVLEKSDAELFAKFCKSVWMIGSPTALVYDLDNLKHPEIQINFSEAKHLDSLGLVSFESMSGYKRTGFIKNFAVLYFGRPVILEMKSDKSNDLDIGKCLLTEAGVQLAHAVPAQPSKRIFDQTIEKWVEKGVVVNLPIAHAKDYKSMPN